MDNSATVHVCNGVGDALDEPGGLPFGEFSTLVEEFLEISVEAVFHHQVNARIVPEVAVEAQNVGVTRVQRRNAKTNDRWVCTSISF